MSKGVFRLLSWKSGSQVTSPFQYYTNIRSKSRFQQSMSSLFWTNLRAEKNQKKREVEKCIQQGMKECTTPLRAVKESEAA